MVHVGVEIEREPVEGDPFADPDPDRAYLGGLIGLKLMLRVLSRIDPDPGRSGIDVSEDVVVGEGVDDGLFEQPDVVVDAEFERIEIHDGITHKLTRAVVGDISASIGLVEGDPMLSELGIRREDVGRCVWPSGDGDERGVLNHHHAPGLGVWRVSRGENLRMMLDLAMVRRLVIELFDRDMDKRFHARLYGHRDQMTYTGCMGKVHPTAIVDSQVQMGDGAEIGPLCILTGKVVLGEGVRLIGHVSIQGPVEIGANSIFYPNSAIGFEPQDYKFKPGASTAGVVIGRDSIFRECTSVHAASNDHTPTRIGDRTMLMFGSHAGHDAKVGNDVILVNSTHLGGHSVVEDRVIMSGGSMLHQFCRVGRQAMTSGNTVLTGDLPPFCMAVGRNTIVGLNLVGMRRSGMPGHEIDAVRYAYKSVLRRNPSMPVMKEMLNELGQQSAAVRLIADFVSQSKKPMAPVGGRHIS